MDTKADADKEKTPKELNQPKKARASNFLRNLKIKERALYLLASRRDVQSLRSYLICWRNLALGQAKKTEAVQKLQSTMDTSKSKRNLTWIKYSSVFWKAS